MSSPISRSSGDHPSHRRALSEGSQPAVYLSRSWQEEKIDERDREIQEKLKKLPKNLQESTIGDLFAVRDTLQQVAQIPLPPSPSPSDSAPATPERAGSPIEGEILARASYNPANPRPLPPVPSRVNRAWNKAKSGFETIGFYLWATGHLLLDGAKASGTYLKGRASALGTYLKGRPSAIKTSLENHPKRVKIAKRAAIVTLIALAAIGIFAAGGLFGHYVGYDNAAQWIKDKAVITGNWINATAHKIGHWFKHTAGPRLRDAFTHTPKFEGWKNISMYTGSALAVVGASAAGTVFYIRHKGKKDEALRGDGIRPSSSPAPSSPRPGADVIAPAEDGAESGVAE